MNSLFITVKKTSIELALLKRRRVFLRTMLDPACADLALILRAYKPTYATVILDAGHAESQFLPVGRLSWADRLRLRRRAMAASPSASLILPPVCRMLGADSKPFLVVTACELSPLSQNVLEALTRAKIPVKCLDLQPRLLLEQATRASRGHPFGRRLNKEESAWSCALSENELGVTMIIGGHGHLVMIRSLPLSTNWDEEIIQTFHYLEREVYVPSEGLTILKEEGGELTLNLRVIAEALGGPVTLGRLAEASAEGALSLPIRHLPHGLVDRLHRRYFIPNRLTQGAIAASLILAPLALYNGLAVHREKLQLETVVKKSYAQPSARALHATFQEQVARTQKRRKWTNLWVYNASQTAFQRGFFPFYVALWETLQKTMFVQDFVASSTLLPLPSGQALRTQTSVPLTGLSLHVTAQPTALHQVPASGAEALLRQAYAEAVHMAQQTTLMHFHQNATLQGGVDSARKTVTFDLSLGDVSPLPNYSRPGALPSSKPHQPAAGVKKGA